VTAVSCASSSSIKEKKENQKKRNIKSRKIDKRKMLVSKYTITISLIFAITDNSPIKYKF